MPDQDEPERCKPDAFDRFVDRLLGDAPARTDRLVKHAEDRACAHCCRGETTVVNIRHQSCDSYGGRGTEIGNPFHVGRDGSLKDVIAKFAIYFQGRIRTSREFKNYVISLRGKKLGCSCKPAPCHLDVVADWLNSHPDEAAR